MAFGWRKLVLRLEAANGRLFFKVQEAMNQKGREQENASCSLTQNPNPKGVTKDENEQQQKERKF
jgi:hypothetical protein